MYTCAVKSRIGQGRHSPAFLNVASCLLVYCLVSFQPTILVGGFNKLLVSLGLGFLLAFVVTHPRETFKLVAACLQKVPAGLAPLVADRQWKERSPTSCRAPNEPSLTSLFQRPPPVLS